MARGRFASMIAEATERSRLADADWGRSPEANARIEKGSRMSPKATAGPSLLRDPIGLKSAPAEERTSFWPVTDTDPYPSIDLEPAPFITSEAATPSLPSHGENWGTW